MRRIPGSVALSALLLAVMSVMAGSASALQSTAVFGRPNAGESGLFGHSVAAAGDLNNDGWPDLIVGAPFDNALGLEAGRAFIWFGGPDMQIAPDLVLDDGSAGDWYGFSVAGVGDVDGDGFPDVAVGAPGDDRPGAKQGAVYVYRGGPGMDAVVDLRLDGEVGGDRFGWAVSAAGDLDRDGTEDLVVGAPYSDAGGTDAGRAYLFLGQDPMSAVGPTADRIWTGTATGTVNTSNFADFAPDGEPITGSGFGFSVARVMDFRGDGEAAVAVGAPGTSGSQGEAYLFFASTIAGQLPSVAAGVTFTNSTALEEFGWSVASGGYLDNDLNADLLVGAPGDGGNTGSVSVYFGSAAPATTISIADFSRSPGIAGDRFGFSVAGAGDVEGNGRNWIVGAPEEDTAGLLAGRVYLYSGVDAVPMEIAPVNGTASGFSDDRWGFSVAGLVADLNGDGPPDFLVGAPMGNAKDSSVLGVCAVLTAGPRVVAIPNARLESARRLDGQVELGFEGEGLEAVEGAVLWSADRLQELARLGDGIWPDERGLVAMFPESALNTGNTGSTGGVELVWTIEGRSASASFRLPILRVTTATLRSPVPNPFNPRTVLVVDLPESGPARLRVLDLRGRVVRELVSGDLPAGETPVVFDGLDDRGQSLASGSYLAVLEAGGTRQARRLTLVR